MKFSNFKISSGWIDKYKLALSKSYCGWDISYCVRLIITLLAVNLVRLEFPVSEVIFFWFPFSDF